MIAIETTIVIILHGYFLFFVLFVYFVYVTLVYWYIFLTKIYQYLLKATTMFMVISLVNDMVNVWHEEVWSLLFWVN